MTDGKLVLTFPKKRCKEVVVRGVQCIQIDTGLTSEEFLEMLLRYRISGEKEGYVAKVGVD